MFFFQFLSNNLKNFPATWKLFHSSGVIIAYYEPMVLVMSLFTQRTDNKVNVRHDENMRM